MTDHADTASAAVATLGAASVAARRALRSAIRSGSYTCPVFHSVCIRTASLRATAMTAFFLAVLLPRSARCKPQRRKSESLPNGPSICCAH